MDIDVPEKPFRAMIRAEASRMACRESESAESLLRLGVFFFEFMDDLALNW
ncbi:MAG: hypothetical protein RLN87_05035 [Parasphingopyxis sp.]|uniref:hypothetical protein n=1 Tax=Parasphingopyxis sp. TaxID=1920299 RepID=UPI0032EEA244